MDHDYDFEKGPAKWRHLERNRWATLIRTYPAALLRCSPRRWWRPSWRWSRSSIAGGWFGQKLRAWGDMLRAAAAASRAARDPGGRGSARRGSPAALTADLDSPYLGAPAARALCAAALRAYWSVVRRCSGLGPRPPARRRLLRRGSVAGAVRPAASRRAQLLVEPGDLLGEDLGLLGEPRRGDREVQQQQEGDAECGDEEALAGTAMDPIASARSSSSVQTASTSSATATSIQSSA